ncbi:cytochrome P450 [Fomitiporia mediterranea MF3/22]|uniref:cytochrome P450 n=1 Tax=Fomitiporia mediterranea (strain MF3/22) TaxID=694068 RepID=UPI0004407795|nr:cytochrome P450 [Fomitiporia mediterranea MF3/22]EJD08594.1 cytochrome P450 [Fomitiporia mediterranea MF3/22]
MSTLSVSDLVGLPWDIDAKTTILGLLAAFATYRIYVVVGGLKTVNSLPGLRCIFEPFTFFGAVTPESWWHPGLNFQWSQRVTLYRRYGLDTISIVPFLWGSAKIWTANLDVARQIVAGGPTSPWIKPKEYSAALLLWGMNLAGAEGGDVWRRHRRIMGPAFNNKTYTLVWNETRRVYKEMVAHEGWLAEDTIDIPTIQTYTFKLALLIIASCGFGLPFSWDEPPTGSDGSMSLQEALRVASEYNLARTSAPKWFWKLPIKKYQYVESANRTLGAFMKNQVALRKQEIRQDIVDNGKLESERSDVFSRLVLANESEAEKLPLDEEELIGNVFVLLFAGHETTGHTLAATLGFLGIYQEEQDAVYEQIMNAIGYDRDPTFEDYPALYKVLSAFYEALRLIPAGSVMIRSATKDTTLNIPNATDKEGTQDLFVPKNSVVCVDMVGIQYNPRYYPDPLSYKPSRWYAQETSELPDAFTAFSIGPRACIGRKFAMTEAVCWLSMFLRDFKVEVVLNAGESQEEARDRVLQAQMVMTLAVKPVSIRLVKRAGRKHAM